MEPELTNNYLQPPERIVSDDSDENVIDHILGWVKKNYTASDLFDLYEHDREVAITFYKWALDYGAIHLADQLAGKYPTHERLWEIFCSQPKK